MRKKFHMNIYFTATVTETLWEQYSQRLVIKYLYITCWQDSMHAIYWPGG